MLLTVDVGNTNTVLGIFQGDQLIRSWRVKTDPRTTSDELWLQYRSLVADYEITGLSICSTVPATLRELRTMMAEYLQHIPTTIVEPGAAGGSCEDELTLIRIFCFVGCLLLCIFVYFVYFFTFLCLFDLQVCLIYFRIQR